MEELILNEDIRVWAWNTKLKMKDYEAEIAKLKEDVAKLKTDVDVLKEKVK